MAHWLAYLTTLQPRSVVELFGGVDYCTQCTVLVRTGTIEKGLEQRLVRYCPILYVHVYIPGRLEAVWGRHGLGLSNACYFYALVTQLPISDLRSTVICVKVTIRSVFGGLGS